MINNFDWIPWKRFVLTLLINDKAQDVYLGRFRLEKSARKEANRLSQYEGYSLKVVDTKATDGAQERHEE